jgi:hypothetical protein
MLTDDECVICPPRRNFNGFQQVCFSPDAHQHPYARITTLMHPSRTFTLLAPALHLWLKSTDQQGSANSTVANPR